MVINKAQGQSLQEVGRGLREVVMQCLHILLVPMGKTNIIYKEVC
jgi:hypothetical protein